MKNEDIKKLCIFGVVILFCVTSALCFFWSKDQSSTVYLREAVLFGDITHKVIATGETAAAQLVIVGAQASGQIRKLYVRLGQHVEKGDLIAEIDSTTQLNDINTNKALLEMYESRLASRRVALRVAQSHSARELRLKKDEATTPKNLENAENMLAAAEADVMESQLQVVQTRIAVNTAEVNLSYTKIVAPMSGVIVSVPVEEGQTVNANQTTPTIVEMADLSRMEIKILISEGDITKVYPQMPVAFTILSNPTKIYTAILDSIDPGITTLTDGKSENLGGSTEKAIYYYGRALVDNRDGSLRIGMTTQNEIIVAAKKNVLIAPTLAIREKSGKKYALTLSNGVPEEKHVVVGLSDSMHVEIISGLQEGDQVVIEQMSQVEINEHIDGSF